MPTITGYKNRLLAAGVGLTDGQAERAARKLAYWAEKMQDVHEDALSDDTSFYTALRILGIYSDPTARDACAA